MACIICEKSLNDCDKSSFVAKPRNQGILTIILAAEKRRDACGKRILMNKDAILSGKMKIKYHTDCRKTYTSHQNIEHTADHDSGACSISSIAKRRNDYYFDIRSMCLICNRVGTKNKKKMIDIQTATGKTTYLKIMEAAKLRNDEEMIGKLSGYEDLFAYDAKYHKNCYSSYISLRNIEAHQKKFQRMNEFSTSQFDKTSDASKSGDSDLSTAGFSADTKQSTTNNFNDDLSKCNIQSEMQILHAAAGILRKEMLEFCQKQNCFPNPNNINASTFEAQVPRKLLTFISLLIDQKIYNNASMYETNPQAAIPSNIIMGLFDKKLRKNSFQIGLGIYLYHSVRSKLILDTLSKIGLTCSYDDVRGLMTGLAKQSIQKHSNVYIPPGIEMVNETSKNYIHASIDNFDLNEETIDGKGTTHSMAMVVFQKQSDNEIFYDDIVKERQLSLTTEEAELPFQNILRYPKPQHRAEPPRFCGNNLQLNRTGYELSQRVNLTWKLLRYFEDRKPFLGWTDYHNILSQNNIPVSEIMYLPFLNAPPTEFDTIYTSMVRLVQLAATVNQKHIVIAADLAIYCKAKEILWNNPVELDGKVILQLGGMHLNMALIASIGYLFGDGGLTSILVESDVYAENSCNLMMTGKQYSRAIRGLTLAADALTRLFFKSLIQWYEHNNNKSLVTEEFQGAIKELTKEFHSFCADRNNYEVLIKKFDFFEKIMKEFANIGIAFSATFKYWYSFLEAVELLWKMLRAERDGDFNSHLCAVYEALPYLKAAGRNLYSKWIPIYLTDMDNLKTEVPYMYEYLAEGNFVVKKTTEKRFNCVASDMALEQSINRDCKSSAGVVGFTQKPTALLRWMVTRHTLGKYSQNFLEATSGIQERFRKESDATKTRNVNDVFKILNTIEDWCNPFDLDTVPSNLIHICTGRVVDVEVETSLVQFLETGREQVQTFWNNMNVDSFWKPIKRDKVLTFRESKVKTKNSIRKLCIGSELMFRRIVCAARFQDIEDLSNLLSFELTQVPASLFHDDGSMRKTAKSELAKKLCNESLSVGPHVESLIIDGMVSVQELKETLFVTFNDLASIFLSNILRTGRYCQASRISIVFDSYKSNSLKYVERSRRGDVKVNREFNLTGTRKVPKFRDFLKSSKNKRSLLIFISKYIIENGPKVLNESEILIIAGGFEDTEKVVAISRNETNTLKTLNCNHDEADTRIIFHLLSESTYSKSILVKSVDTDVLLLLVHHYTLIPDINKCNLFLQLGHGNTKNYVDIHKICDNLGTLMSTSLLSIHCLTGCDTTNAFFKIGKKTAFDVLLKYINNLKELSLLPSLPEDKALEVCRRYVLYLYKNKNQNVRTLNELRFYLATNTNKPASELPPTDDAFEQHFKRCIYQLKIWYSSYLPQIDIGSPIDSGWKFESGHWEPVMGKQDPIPEEVRKVLDIYCSDKNCLNNKCQCVKEGLKCCSQCKCKNCSNSLVNDNDSDSDCSF